ncbi:MAG TPA: histidinol-phosphate transaminase [Verrucomicrobiae bacterium]|nr:histidinol-phosphate transaminase [Verrucomicrobiae bacterium]
MSKPPELLIRPLVRALHPYAPGEQPKITGLIKLNTNENPYPPAPAVLRAIRVATDARLRLYPDPAAQKLRERLAIFHSCHPENIFIGNGSDEVLALALRAFVEPASEAGGDRSTVQYFTPSYSLYPVLAAAHGARSNAIALEDRFALPSVPALKRSKKWRADAALTLITTPNAPSGRGYGTAELDRMCRAHRGVVLLDEAYVDFARENALKLALHSPHVLVARTFSKAYSLCFLRVGYCVGHPALIEALDKVRDSYNVNGLGQIAALATLENLPYYRKNFARVMETRAFLTQELSALGFDVLPSETNFLLARPPGPPAEEWLRLLRERKILVRWFSYPEVRQYLRITVGRDQEARALVRAAREILRGI